MPLNGIKSHIFGWLNLQQDMSRLGEHHLVEPVFSIPGARPLRSSPRNARTCRRTVGRRRFFLHNFTIQESNVALEQTPRNGVLPLR